MKKKIILLLMVFLFAFCPMLVACDELDFEIVGKTKSPTRILFLGNSLMYYNNMPQMFEQLAKASGKNVFVRSVTEGRSTIRKFAKADQNGTGRLAHYYLSYEQWDYVVIEPSRRINEINYDAPTGDKNFESIDDTNFATELKGALYLKDLAEQNSPNVKVVLYSVWGERSGTKNKENDSDAEKAERIDKVNLMYQANLEIAKKLDEQTQNKCAEDPSKTFYNVPIIKAGLAFESYIARASDTAYIYNEDNQHSDERGSYLAACCAFATIFNESPVGNSYKGDSNGTEEVIQNGLNNYTLLQKVAEEIHNLKPYKLLIVGPQGANTNNTEIERMLTILALRKGYELSIDKVLTGSGYSIGSIIEKNNGSYSFVSEIADLFNKNDYDSVVIQLPREETSTASSTFNNLTKLKSVISENTKNFYLMTLNSTSDKGKDYTDIYETIASSFATAYNNDNSADHACEVISYASVFKELKGVLETAATNAGVTVNNAEGTAESRHVNTLISYILAKNLFDIADGNLLDLRMKTLEPTVKLTFSATSNLSDFDVFRAIWEAIV